MVRPLGLAIAVLAISLNPHTFQAQSAHGLRAFDFRNFTYHLGMSGAVSLSDGRARGRSGLSTRLASVRYIDFNADGLDEAAVVLSTTREQGAMAEDYYVFDYYNQAPRQIFHEWREQPLGMILDHQSLTIIAPYWREQDKRCCPSAVETVVYRWSSASASFVLAARRLRPRPMLD